MYKRQYLLHDTPYALSAETLHNLKRGLLTYRFFCAGLCVPAGTAGRFPLGQEVLQELLPAFSYAAYAFPEPDADLLAAVKRLLRDYPAQVGKVLDQVDSDLSYTATVGEAELLERAWQSPVKAEEAPCGALFMPYSGLLVVRNSDIHFNVKGFGKYIWDFESSDTENLAGRYLSNGQVEYFDLRNGVKSFNPQSEDFDWSLIPGTTSILLPYDVLKEKKHRKGFSDTATIPTSRSSRGWRPTPGRRCSRSGCTPGPMTATCGLTSLSFSSVIRCFAWVPASVATMLRIRP